MEKSNSNTLPRIIFRYQSLSEKDDSKKWTLETLRSSSFRLSGHEEFPDWFDCRPPRDISFQSFCETMVTELEAKKILMPEKAVEIDREIILFRANDKSVIPLYETIHQRFNAELVKTGIKSFCSPAGGEGHNNNMWLNYADHYKGICLIFDSSNPWFEKLHPVTYPEKRVPLKMMLNEGESYGKAFDIVFLQKSPDFAYENEYRMVAKEGKGVFVPFRKASLVEVQFGFEISDDDRKLVASVLLEAKYPHVKLWDMEPDMRRSNFKSIYAGEIMNGDLKLDKSRMHEVRKST